MPYLPIIINWVKSNLENQDVKPVLGRLPFFKYFKVLICEKSQTVELKPNISVIKKPELIVPKEFNNLVGLLSLK
jgi:hypothetical protein